MRIFPTARKPAFLAFFFVTALLLLHRYRTRSTLRYDLLIEIPSSLILQRRALSTSPFSLFSTHNRRQLAETGPQHGFRSWPLLEKCRWYFYNTYAQNASWTNDEVLNRFEDPRADNSRLSHIFERLRMFDTCFVEGHLTITQVLPSDQNSLDFHRRMFPFLAPFSAQNDIWPTISHLNSGKQLPAMTNLNTAGATSTKQLPFDIDPSRSFWENWSAFSSGKGLVLSLAERHQVLFYRLLRVLDHLDNKFPIQLVQQRGELSPGFLESLSKFLHTTNQQVYVVDCGPTLNDVYAKHMTYFVNKWIATIFNTFSEFILLDADVVPFVDLATFFDDRQFQNSGSLMYKDRDLTNEFTFDYCIEMFKYLEPSAEAVLLMDHRMKANVSVVDPLMSSNTGSEEELIYSRFFYNKVLHNVDSGLVVMNKVQKLPSLVMSFFMNLDSKASNCVYGDKELFWIGHLFSGKDYSVDANYGAVVGPIQTHDNSDRKNYKVCATQMGHVNAGKELLWTNGGLKTCKIPTAAEQDFQSKPSYFEAHYSSVQQLQELYQAPLVIDGYITPEIATDPWLKGNECCEYAYCATANIPRDQDIESRDNIAVFNKSMKAHYNEIAFIWNHELNA
ncbi:LAFA_0D08152g1_1 [Lachancea sp. 'fantastica']|nr:LAFA_0D08152g1_1 [Lachancea sp. 'fantastica']